MTIEIALTLAVILGALVLLALEWLPADLLLLGALGLLTVAGVVDLESALTGFADPTLLAIGSLYVVAAGLRHTGVLRKAAHLLFGAAASLRSVLLRLSVAPVGSSAFLNNTPVVAMGIPAVLSWSRERGVPPSRLLIPLGGREVQSEALSDEPLWQPTRAKLGLAVLVAVVGLATAGVVHISLAALGGALTMVVAGFVSPADARRSIDWSVLIVIGSAIGLATALDRSGAAGLVAEGIVALGTPLGARGILAALLLGTMVFTLTITNNAAVAIAFPIAMSVASSQGLDPRPLVISVTVGASLAFATPLGYQTNLMVYGPGGYRFADFVRAGLPLQILLGILVVVVAPWIWPF